MAAGTLRQPGSSTSWLGGFVTVLLATAWAEIQRKRAYTIEIIRWPVYPAIYFVTLLIAYRVSGQQAVGGFNVEGFLLVGTIGMVLWTSTIWSGGYAIEIERVEGTINSLFLTPASRVAVIYGYGLGNYAMFAAPTVAVVFVMGAITGADFNIQSPLAVALSLCVLGFGALALGHALAGGFVLTRRANMWANFVQSPIYLLSGMVVPVSALPDWLEWFATIFPISAGMDALRQSLLAGADVGDVSGSLVRFSLSSLALLIIGSLLLRRVENVAKRGGQFDLD